MIASPCVQSLVVGIGLCILAASLPAQAQWKWKDERGQIQYSDLPPPKGTPPANILQRPMPPPPPVTIGVSAPGAAASVPGAAATPATAASAVDPALQARRKQAEQEEAAKRQAEEARVAQTRAQNCERARASLRSLESGIRIAGTNEKGEREIMDDRTRAQETQQARQVVASDCR